MKLVLFSFSQMFNYCCILFATNSLLGQRNLVYLICMLALWYVTGIYEIFFAFTSYVHYFRYFTYTYCWRRCSGQWAFCAHIFRLVRCIRHVINT